MRFLIVTSLSFCLWASSVLAQESIIMNALNTHPSVVGVRAKVGHLEHRGAGVILNSSGIIVTNLHTINQAEIIRVQIQQHPELGAKIIQLMPESDLALIQVQSPYPLSPIAFADCYRIRLRDPVYNIGNSSILHRTISGGHVTGLGTSKGSRELAILKVNMNLYEGDSGGPLLNPRGELLGMMVAKDRTQQRAAYAIPANKIKKIYMALRN